MIIALLASLALAADPATVEAATAYVEAGNVAELDAQVDELSERCRRGCSPTDSANLAVVAGIRAEAHRQIEAAKPIVVVTPPPTVTARAPEPPPPTSSPAVVTEVVDPVAREAVKKLAVMTNDGFARIQGFDSSGSSVAAQKPAAPRDGFTTETPKSGAEMLLASKGYGVLGVGPSDVELSWDPGASGATILINRPSGGGQATRAAESSRVERYVYVVVANVPLKLYPGGRIVEGMPSPVTVTGPAAVIRKLGGTGTKTDVSAIQADDVARFYLTGSGMVLRFEESHEQPGTYSYTCKFPVYPGSRAHLPAIVGQCQ